MDLSTNNCACSFLLFCSFISLWKHEIYFDINTLIDTHTCIIHIHCLWEHTYLWIWKKNQKEIPWICDEYNSVSITEDVAHRFVGKQVRLKCDSSVVREGLVQKWALRTLRCLWKQCISSVVWKVWCVLHLKTPFHGRHNMPS